jgi:predicted MFS family arabinose efflux permease
MTAFGAAYVLARIMFGTLPDRFGGARVAVGSTSIAGAGQALMFFAPNAQVAVAAAALTGFGFSLSFPAFGVEAIKRVPPQNRGVALGAYAACFDLTMGVGVPALGLAAGSFGYAAAFAIGAATSVLALLIAFSLLRPA